MDARWYSYPDLTPDELLLFCQYDRDATRPSDLWHCALASTGDRTSFDVRTLVVFADRPVEDRFVRTGALLTRDESQVFCAEQHRQRQG